MKKRNKITLKGKSNWRTIGTLMVITVCLVSVMMPVMTQSAFSMLNNASNATDGETGETPSLTPSPSPLPEPTSVPSPTPTQSPSPGPSPSLSPTPTPGPTPTLTPTPPPTPTPSPAAPNITSFTPPSPVYDTEGATRTFNISTDQAVNVSWLLNGTAVQTNESVTEASYTNTSPAVGMWDITAITSNENGTVMQTWIWNVSLQATPTPTPGITPSTSPLITPTPTPSPSPIPASIQSLESSITPSTLFYIYGWVHYENGVECNNPIVNITKNTSEGWQQAETLPTSNFFQLVEFMNVSEGNLLVFNVTDGTQFNVTNHVVTQSDINNSGIFGLNLTLGTLPQTDLVVTDLWVDPESPIRGDIVTVTAGIENKGNETNSTAVFYDEKNVSISKSYNVSNLNSTDTWNDTLSQPDALKIRVHFVDIHILGNGSYIKIYNASDNLIHNFSVQTNSWNGTNFWTNWSTDERIKIESHVTNHLNFTIDKYESVFANTSITLLGFGKSEDFKAEWNASAWLNDIEDTAAGNHTIRVQVVANESNTENNNKSTVVEVKLPPIDLALTNVSLNKTPLLDGDLVNVSATVINNGSEDAVNFKVVFLDGLGKGNTSGVPFNETIISMLGAGNVKNVHTTWNASSGYHTITAIVDPDDSIRELNETNNQSCIYVYVNKSRDFAITALSLSYTRSNESCDPEKLFLYEQVTINATLEIINLANRGDKVDVGLYLNETLLNLTSVVFDPGNGTYYAPFEWEVNAAGNHTLKVCADYNNTITEFNETSNNTWSMAIAVRKGHDFAVTNLTFNLTEPVIGDVVEINATIANTGVKKGTTTVKFYDTKSIEIKRTEDDYLEEETINDILTLPDALEIRVHFSYIEYGAFTIYDKNNTKVEEFEYISKITDKWTEWASGDTTRIESEWAEFSVDRYEAVLLNKSISLEPGNFTALPPIQWNLSLQEFGWAIAGTHNITVKVDPYDQIDEFNETNNTQMEVVLVNASLDFAVTNLTFNITEPEVGDVVEINATIANTGIKNGTTTVEFYDNEALLANMSVSLEPGNSTNVPVDWDLSDQYMGWATIGTHNITVTVDPYNQIVELNETNNTKTRMVVVNASLDFTVINISFNTTQPLLNHIVRLNATVTNSGKRNGTATLRAYCDKKIIVNETELSLNFTDPPRIVNMSWIANITNGGAGPHNISVEIDPDNVFAELNETNNTQIEQIFVNGTDLAITKIEMPCGEGEDFCHCGQDVNITATIVNLGAINATNFTVIFRDRLGKGDISDDISPFNSTNITSLVAGNSTTITVLWSPAGDFGIYTITASIPFDCSDNNETNNKLSKFVTVASEYDFSVEDVNVTPGEVREGEPVNITATIGNLGFESENVSVAFYVNYTDFAGTGGERFVRINTTEVYVEAGKNHTTPPIAWNANVSGGHHMVVAVADPPDPAHLDGKFMESIDTVRKGNSIDFFLKGDNSVTGNNVKNCTLSVITPQLNITNLTLDPAQPLVGDEVNVTAEIKNEGSELVNSTVWFYMEQNVSISDGTHSIYRGDSGHLPPWSWSVSLPEDNPVRVHLDYIAIRRYTSQKKETGTNDIINASVDGQPVNFYVKSNDVANGQPIRVPWINLNTPCDKCVEENPENPGECIHKRWEDVWTEWSEGNTIQVDVDAWHEADLNLLIDKYQVRLGNRTVTIGAHNITWNASSPLKPENYMIKVIVEEHNETQVVDLGGTDLAVTNFSPSVREGNWVWDGDQVVINATIENLGRKNATAFWVNFTEVYVPERGPLHIWTIFNITTPINTTLIEGLEVGNTTNVSFVLWNTSIRKFDCTAQHHDYKNNYKYWTETGVNYTIKVEINPLDNSDVEEDETNDYKEASAHVNRSRDFSVMNLSFMVNNKTRNPSELVLYDLVTLDATLNITNHANRGGEVNVSFYVDEIDAEHEIGNDSIRFETFNKSNGTVYAEIKWKIENLEEVRIPGDHNITVIADPENEIYEINELNNASTWQIHVKASDLTVTNLSFDTERPERGEKVQINVTIANYGKENATNVTLALYDWADRHIDNVTTLWNYSGFLWIEVKREDATAMRLYLDLDIKGGEVSIYNSKGEQIKPPYSESFHGWTPWVLGNNITVVTKRNETSRAYAKVSKVYYLEQSKPFNITTHDLVINENKTITVNWTASTDCLGERLIAAIIDPGKNITEYDESNNTKAEYISVLTNDLEVSNLSLRWSNGTLINDTIKIKDGDNVTIVANVTNIGIEEVDNFSVYFLVDDVLIPEGGEIIPNLAPNKSTPVVASWTANVSSHVLKVEADYENVIDETNETNNIVAKERYICGAEVSGNESWETFGLHAEILFDNKTQPYDEDEVNITVNITNYGRLNASDFNMLLFYDYTPKFYHYTANTIFYTNETEIYPGADRVYLRIIDGASKDDIPPGYEWKWNPMDAGDVEVYDAWGKAVLNKTNFNDTCRWAEVREGMSCWIPVRGNTANVRFIVECNEDFIVYFYPVYENETSRLFEGISVPVNGSSNVSMTRTMSTGNFTIMAVMDPENRVPEDDKTDNIVTKVMHVEPTRDFTVTEVEVIPERTNISDGDTLSITANVSNVGFRNGTTRVNFVDYENETRIYNYYFNKYLPLSYLPISPDTYVSSYSSYSDLTIIRRPGVDAIQLNFGEIRLEPPPYMGKIWIYNKNREEVFSDKGGQEGKTMEDKKILVSGDTVFIYTTLRASFRLNGYTTRKELPCDDCEDVTLNASVKWDELGNITARWSESKNITAPQWNASTGDHNITVTIDLDDEIGERNETNNTFILPLGVKATKDLAIVELNVTPLHPDHGKDVYITAVVQNKGNKTVNSTIDLWADTTRNYRADSGFVSGASWVRVQEDRIRYVKLLKHTHVSLGPGEDEPVTAIWENMSVYGDPTHIVTVIADPLDEIDEMNESNNEMSPEIVINYPDLTVAGFNSPTPEKNASVTIENIGARGASNVTVRFYKIIRVDCLKPIRNSGTPMISITKDGAGKMRIHFSELNAEDGTLEIKKHPDLYETPEEDYSGQTLPDGDWTPWVEGNTTWIIYSGLKTTFEIDKYEWGDVEDIIIGLEVSESKNVSFPARWNEYVEPQGLNVTVDPDNVIQELKEGNNNGTAQLYIDLVLKGIDIVGNQLKATVWSDNTLEDGIAFPPACDFEVRCSLFFTPQTINKSFYGGDIEEVWFDLTEVNFRPNRIYNLSVKADYFEDWEDNGVIKEIDETNNKDTVKIGPDIILGSVSVVPSYPLMGRKCFFNVAINNIGEIGTGEFNVRLNILSNETFGYNESFNKLVNLARSKDEPISFEWTPPEPIPPVDRDYDYTVTADPEDKINELNPSVAEKSRSGSIKVFNFTGYAGGRWFEPYANGEVRGDAIFTVGTSYYLGQSNQTIYEVEFDNLLPQDVVEVDFARLYVYWLWSKDLNLDVPVKPVVNVWFRNIAQNIDREYEDNPHATLPNYDCDYGVYCYDVTNLVENNSTARVERISPYIGGNGTPRVYTFGIDGIGLFVAYENGSTLTKYWVTEGADILMARMGVTGLTPKECETYANFIGVDTDRGNATLITVVPWGNDGNMLRFNGEEWENVWRGVPYTDLAIDTRDVTTYYLTKNDVTFQDRGDFMMPTNAFLVVRYPPDLVPSLEKFPAWVAVRNWYDDIPVVIYNRGRSDAKDVKVSFYVDGNPINTTVDVKGGDSTDVTFHWRAPLTIGIVNITVVVDPDNDVDELINSQRNGETNNKDMRNIPVELGGWDERSTGGNTRKETTGTGEDVSAIEGEGAWTKAGSGEATVGEKEGKAITGYLMKGSVAQGEAGGGGKSKSEEFSMLGLLLRIATLGVAVSLVFAGYLLERRRQNNKLSLEKKV